MINQTRAWVETMVIGLDLCPFAKKVFNADTIRYRVSEATTKDDLLNDLRAELQLLLSSERTKIETTLVIIPHLFKDFLEFNDFIDVADKLIGTSGNRGVIQIASFHPKYQFEGTTEDSPENYTNRSPFPMLHLLREQSISEVAESRADLLAIPDRNIKLLKEMGTKKILELLAKAKASSEDYF